MCIVVSMKEFEVQKLLLQTRVVVIILLNFHNIAIINNNNDS